MSDREDNVYMAKLAEQAERYDEMMEHMKKVAKCQKDLKTEERNLLSVAYKNVVGARRASWRILSSLEEKEQASKKDEAKVDPKVAAKVAMISSYKETVETELKQICNEILQVLTEDLIPNSEDIEAKVFYYKMKGDYHRYLAEFERNADKTIDSDNSLKAYKEATVLAAPEEKDKPGLDPTHPIRLGLALNFSVFHYEIRGQPKIACELAKKAFDEAITELDKLKDDSYKDSTLIMQLLRDNLTLWTTDLEQEQEQGLQDCEDEAPQ